MFPFLVEKLFTVGNKQCLRRWQCWEMLWFSSTSSTQFWFSITHPLVSWYKLFPSILLTVLLFLSLICCVMMFSGIELARNTRCLQECIFHRNGCAYCCDSTQLLGSCEACETKDPERRINLSLFKTSDYFFLFFGPFMYTTN